MEGNRKDHEVNEESFDYFAQPQSKDLSLFLQFHPQQTPKRAIPNIFYTKDGLNRKWLTYCEASHALYCTVCLAFSKPTVSESPFIQGGMQAWKHVHQRIEEHESA